MLPTSDRRHVEWRCHAVYPTGRVVEISGPRGTLDWDEDSASVAGGRVSTSVDPGDLIGARLYPVKVLNGTAYQMGEYAATAVTPRYGISPSWQIDLIDLSVIAARTRLQSPLSLPRGSHIVSAVRRRLGALGLDIAIADASETLRVPIAWDVGTDELSVANDLLSAAGLGPVRAAGMRLASERRRDPGSMADVWRLDEANGVQVINYSVDSDHLAIPNRVVGVAAGDGDTVPPLRAVAADERSSRWSWAARGGAWVDAEPIRSDAATQAVLEAEVWAWLRRRQSSMRVTVAHLWDPDIRIGTAGWLTSEKWPLLSGRYIVAGTSIDMEYDALASSSLRRVD